MTRTNPGEYAIIAENIRKKFITKSGFIKKKTRIVEALKGVSLSVNKGEIFGLLGPNGAGKTTLIKILTTLLLPDTGRAYVAGYDIIKCPECVKKRIGVMLMGERALYWKLTGRENLEFFGSLYGIPKRILQERIEQLIDFLGLTEFVDRLVETYSSGQRVLLAFAKALVNDAPIVFLDEPTVALDPRKAVEVRKKILELKKSGKTVFLTTHIMNEADELCDSIAIINKGTIAAVGSPEELKRSLKGKSSVQVEFYSLDPDRIVNSISTLEGVYRVAWGVDQSNGKTTYRLRALCDSPKELLPQILDILISQNASIFYVRPEEPTLEDVFMYYTGELLGDRHA